MKLVAHRGLSSHYPENTLLAFQKAIEVGADAIELDVHFTKDKKVIVHHYFELGQTDNGAGLIFEKDSAYLQSLDAGTWFYPMYKNEKMPLLDEVFSTLKDSTLYEVELKAYGKEFVDSIVQIATNHSLLSTIQFTSYQYPLLSYIKKIAPKATVGFIAPPKPDWMTQSTFQEVVEASLILNEIDVMHIPVDLYDPVLIDRLRRHAVKSHFGLADSKAQIEKALHLGADELTTNNLELALQLVKQTPNS